MNRDDIILMAREAGMKACCGRTDKSGKHHPTVNALFSTVPVQWLEQFANLVASEEREECAKVCDGRKQEGLSMDGCAASIRARRNA